MKRYIVGLLLCSTSAFAEPIKVAVIDTGKASRVDIPYCKMGHKDFTDTGLADTHGHGTNVAGLIAREAAGVDFCIVSIKYFSPLSGAGNLKNLVESVRYAIDLNVDVINISSGGLEYSREEALVIQKALNKGIKILAAAGNENTDFSQKCQYYPACYDDRIVSVGCMKENFEPCSSSNFGGKIKMVRIGDAQKAGGLTMTGTSQATAIATGIYIRVLSMKRSRGE